MDSGVEISKHPKKFYLVVFIGPQKDYKRSKDIFNANDDDGHHKIKMLMMMIFMISLGDHVVEEEGRSCW